MNIIENCTKINRTKLKQTKKSLITTRILHSSMLGKHQGKICSTQFSIINLQNTRQPHIV